MHFVSTWALERGIKSVILTTNNTFGLLKENFYQYLKCVSTIDEVHFPIIIFIVLWEKFCWIPFLFKFFFVNDSTNFITIYKFNFSIEIT